MPSGDRGRGQPAAPAGRRGDVVCVRRRR
eukprot:SAG25_NODE_249_length_11020_cov_5.841590_12_plen_28_part_01